MPLGVLGGTFDPVHDAHLAIAQHALAALALASVRWIPAGRPVHRPPPVASAGHRLAMLELALAGEPRFVIDRRELEPAATGYTYDTLNRLRTEFGHAVPIVLLMGADQAAQLDQWHRWRELFALAHVGLFARPGPAARPAAAVRTELAARRGAIDGEWRRHPAGAVLDIGMAPVAVSASEIRKQLARGELPVSGLPQAVLDYIRQHHLYRETP